MIKAAILFCVLFSAPACFAFDDKEHILSLNFEVHNPLLLVNTWWASRFSTIAQYSHIHNDFIFSVGLADVDYIWDSSMGKSLDELSGQPRQEADIHAIEPSISIAYKFHKLRGGLGGLYLSLLIGHGIGEITIKDGASEFKEKLRYVNFQPGFYATSLFKKRSHYAINVGVFISHLEYSGSNLPGFAKKKQYDVVPTFRFGLSYLF